MDTQLAYYDCLDQLGIEVSNNQEPVMVDMKAFFRFSLCGETVERVFFFPKTDMENLCRAEFTANYNTETERFSWMQQRLYHGYTCVNVVIIQALDAGLGILHPQSRLLDTNIGISWPGEYSSLGERGGWMSACLSFEQQRASFSS